MCEQDREREIEREREKRKRERERRKKNDWRKWVRESFMAGYWIIGKFFIECVCKKRNL